MVYPLPPSWMQSQTYCQEVYGTNLAFYKTVDEFMPFFTRLSFGGKMYVGLRKATNDSDSNWIPLDGDCPIPSSSLCAQEWEKNEPNNLYHLENCAEINKNAELNDIICDSVPYAWIEGFVCNAENIGDNIGVSQSKSSVNRYMIGINHNGNDGDDDDEEEDGDVPPDEDDGDDDGNDGVDDDDDDDDTSSTSSNDSSSVGYYSYSHLSSDENVYSPCVNCQYSRKIMNER